MLLIALVVALILTRVLASILDEVNIDFEPLYRCIHVYETLGKRNEFKTSYSEDRRVSFPNIKINSKPT